MMSPTYLDHFRTISKKNPTKLVAQAAQVASAQPEKVRSTLLDTGDSGNVCCIIRASNHENDVALCFTITSFQSLPDLRMSSELLCLTSHFVGNMRQAPYANLKIEN